MAKNVKPKKDEGGEGGAISNVPDGDKIMGYVDQIETLHKDLGLEKSESMTRCKVIHSDIKQVYADAKKAGGLNKKALTAIIDERALKAKLAAIPDKLEGDASDAYATYALALEKLAA